MGFGQYKPEASGLLCAYSSFLNGRDYRGKRTHPAGQWREMLPDMPIHPNANGDQ